MNNVGFNRPQSDLNHKVVIMIHRLFVVITLILFLLPSCTKVISTIPEASPTVAAPSRIQLGDYKLFSPEDMQADLNELFTKLEISHPDLYANRSKEEVNADRQKVLDELNHPVTIFDYFLIVSPLIESLGDMHTKILPPDEMDPEELFFPLQVEFFGQRVVITYNISDNPDIPFRSELISINGIALSSLPHPHTLYQFFQMSFSFYLWCYFGSVPEYQVELLPSSTASPAAYQMHGMTVQAIQAQTASSNQPLPERFTYQTLPDSNIGVMTINTFDGSPSHFLAAAFDQIRQDHVQHLIIDIRSNEGGDYDQLTAVMSYLTSQPYRTCSKAYERYVSEQEQPPREIACDLLQPMDRTSRFEGDIYLLIGPDTFSAAITFATILQDYNLATIAGEETIDKASFCGDPSDPMLLSHTHLQYTYAKVCFVRPGGILDNRGVIPDVIVKTTIDDYMAGRDPVLAKAIELTNINTP
jgi:hypothetical protein